ncbi:N-acetyltransferase family protein [Streptomyces sp. NPDC002643]
MSRVTGARVIRTVLPAEAQAVAALHARVRAACRPDGAPDDGTDERGGDGTDGQGGWRRAIERPGGRVLCAVEHGGIVGVAAFRPAGGAPVDTVRLLCFHIAPDHRHRGTGRALHAACVEEWQADGTRTATLVLPAADHRARAFYTRLGWTPAPAALPAARCLPLTYAVPAPLPLPGE